MTDSIKNTDLDSNSCRRLQTERRSFSYSAYIPERRSGKDRRSDGEPGSKLEAGEMRFPPKQKFRIKKTYIKFI